MVFVNCDKLVQGFKDYMDKDHPKKVESNFRKMRHSQNGIIMYFQKDSANKLTKTKPIKKRT